MVLLQNKTINAQYPVRQSGAAGFSERTTFGPYSNNSKNKYVGEAGLSKSNSKPNGYTPTGGAWEWNITSGGLAVYHGFESSGTLSFANIAGGVNINSSMNGTGDITQAIGGLILSAIATLTGSGQIYSASINAKLEAAAILAGQGSITASIGALAGAVSTIIGTGNISNSSEMHGTGYMDSAITPFTTLSPQNLAQNVWNSLATEFNNVGTMGQKLNGAGTAGDPWGTSVPGAYAVGTAGYILGNSGSSGGSGGGLTTTEHNQLMSIPSNTLLATDSRLN